jgi:hypothetical protein
MALRIGGIHSILAVVAFAASCAPAKTAARLEKKQAQPDYAALASGAKPGWIAENAFVDEEEESFHVYAVAACPIEDKDVCWKPPLLIQACRNRALAELAKAIGSTSQDVQDSALVTTASATIDHAVVNRGWYDGDRTLYAVAEQLRPKDAPKVNALVRSKLSGGATIPRLEESVRNGAKAALERSGVCRDPHRRSSYACCGRADTFCSDPTRFDAQLGGGKCKCGDFLPCLFDFRCLDREGKKKCLCQGAKCPCEGLNCKKGQTCGDGRCY